MENLEQLIYDWNAGSEQATRPSRKKIEFDVLILFPWDLVKRKFKGERVWFLL